ncbi:Plasma membrane low glucose sensor [Phlyctochytrium planicorne]|nr:Plasma membrane low glucose sensor [Phlyctochytrium planicorne]
MSSASKESNAYTWLVAFSAAMGGLLFGYEIGVNGQVLGFAPFQNDFNLQAKISNGTEILDPSGNPTGSFYFQDNPFKESREAIITSTFLFGCIAGSFVCSFLADRIGRKRSILLGGCIFTLGGCIQAAAQSLGGLLAGRTISGFAVGIMSMVVSLYIAETAPSGIRGRLTTLYQFLITVGILLANCVNAAVYMGLRDREGSVMWRTALAMQVVPSVLFVIAVTFIPMSPRWLAEKGRIQEGLAVVARLRSKNVEDQAVIDEFDGIVKGVEAQKAVGIAPYSELLQRGILRRVLIGMVNASGMQLSGVNVILYYCTTVFLNLGFTGADSEYNSLVSFPIANSFIICVATIPGIWAIEKVGRKQLFVYGGLLMGVGHTLLYAFITGSMNGNKSLSWGAIFAIYQFLFAFASTWGPVVWAYQAEIFPLRVRAKANGVCTMTNWAWNAAVAYAFPIVFKALNLQPTVYLIFASLCFAMGVWAFFGVPETRGKTLEEMDEIFGGAPRRDHETGADGVQVADAVAVVGEKAKN